MRRSKTQFLSASLGALYTIYLIRYFSGLGSDLGSSLASFIVTPHILCCALGSIFGIVAFFNNSRAMSLTSSILFCVAAIIFMTYAPMVVPSIIFGFIGYARIGSIRREYDNTLH